MICRPPPTKKAVSIFFVQIVAQCSEMNEKQITRFCFSELLMSLFTNFKCIQPFKNLKNNVSEVAQCSETDFCHEFFLCDF